MAKHWSGQFSFITGTVRRKNLGYLAVVNDEVSKRKLSQSIIVVWDNGVWKTEKSATKDWDVVAGLITANPKEQALFMGEHGEVYCIGSGDTHDEMISGKNSSPRSRGAMRGLGRINNLIYAVGMNRQAYRRNSNGQWESVDKGARPKTNREEVVGFEAVDGFGDKEIYSVGWGGEIWQYDGNEWVQRQSPTNMVLVSVRCGEDGNVYACGRVGMLVRGREERWEVIDHQVINDDIWDMAWFKGKLFLSTLDALYVLEGKKLKLVRMGKDQPATCFRLSVADGMLWSIGAKDVVAYDGERWTRID